MRYVCTGAQTSEISYKQCAQKDLDRCYCKQPSSGFGHDLAWNASIARISPHGELRCLRCARVFRWDNRHNVKRQPCQGAKKRRDPTPPKRVSARMYRDDFPRLYSALLALMRATGMFDNLQISMLRRLRMRFLPRPILQLRVHGFCHFLLSLLVVSAAVPEGRVTLLMLSLLQALRLQRFTCLAASQTASSLRDCCERRHFFSVFDDMG